MKSKEEKVLDLKLKINNISLAIQKLKNWNAMNMFPGNEKCDLNVERTALLEESKRLFLSRLKELEEEEEKEELE